MIRNGHLRGRSGLWLASVCSGALLTGLAMPAAAQDSDAASGKAQGAEEDETQIIVTGQRANLDSAQNRKRNAETVVDSISSEDIGSFPDKSVAEALQRVPGITVVRFAGTDDTSHFSAEPSGVIVRGLPQVRSEFNGRDTFSANSSRGLTWQDISPELLAGVDTYKNQTADMIEGGIAGTINLRTRLPLDTNKDVFSIGVMGNYGDIAGQITPEASGVITKRFETDRGTFGVMLNAAYSQVKTGSQGIQFDRMGIFAPGTFGPGTTYIPSGIWMRDNIYDRKRLGLAGALQWESADGTTQATLQYTRSQYENSWREHSIYSSAYSIYGLPTDFVGSDPSVVQPLQGKPAFTFDDQGNFTSGWWSAPRPYVGEGNDNVGLGVNSSGQAFFNRCYAWEGCTNARRAPQLDSGSNALRNNQYTQDFAFNFKFSPRDRVRINLDAQYVDSKVRNYNASVATRTFANTFIDLTGKYPTFTFEPNTGDNLNLSPGGVTNPNNYHYYAITDHTEDSNGSELALRADVEYDFETTWLNSLKIGARYADRDQTVRWGAYNWANISNTWTYTQAPYFNIDRAAYPAGNYGNYTFGQDFFNGNQMNQREFVFFNMDRLVNREGLAQGLGRPTTGVGDYYPVCSNAGYRAGETVTAAYGCYLPNEILKLSERTVAGYAMLRFGGPDASIGGVGISGNIGGRLIFTKNDTEGARTLPPAFTPTQLLCERGTNPEGLPTASAGCVTTADEIAFNNGAFVANVASEDHIHFLPSFNLKLDFTNRLVSRFAYSRAISRPDVGLLRNFTTITRIAPNLADRSNPDIIFGPDGQTITGYNFRYRGQAGNPGLKPIVADQFDLTLEYYFGRASSLTATAFYKKFNNYIQSGTYNLAVNNNGVSRNVLVTGPMNGDGASIKGAELAFQTFFDFLPSPLDGLGVQANYTYVDNNGIETINLTNETGSGTAGGGVSYDATAVKANALEGISTHSYNIVGMYEKGPASVRVAYNWRSKYLVTAIDCCVGLPIWQEANGYLDASVRLRLTRWLEFILQGSNLLGTDTVLYQQVDNTGLLKRNSWFKNDRRVQMGVRITM